MRLIIAVVLALALAVATSVYADRAAVSVMAITGSWSYEIKNANPVGGGKDFCQPNKVYVNYDQTHVYVTMYNCSMSRVKIKIENKATVPLCLTPKGQVIEKNSVELLPKDRNINLEYTFYANGTLTFEKKIGRCGGG